MNKKIRVGIIGLGGPGRGHLKGFTVADGVEVTALCDFRREILDEQGALHGIKNLYADYKTMLKEDCIDAVSVCLPNYLHYPVSKDALLAGKHVFCEKPPTLNAAEALDLLKISRNKKRLLMYALCTRFSPQAKYVRQLVDQGELGEIYFGKAVYTRRSGIPIGSGGWFVDKKRSGGGALIDIGVHPLDCVWWLMGAPQPEVVLGSTYQKFRHTVPDNINFDVDDSAFAIIRFANGATLMLECSWALFRANGSAREIAGTTGGACLDPLRIFTQRNGTQMDITPELPDNCMVGSETAHFARCIRNEEKPISSAEQGATLMRMLDAVYQSSQTGKETRLAAEIPF